MSVLVSRPEAGRPLADPRFMRFVELLTELRKAGVLDLLGDPRKEVAFDIVIGGYAQPYAQKVREFLALLDLQMPAVEF